MVVIIVTEKLDPDALTEAHSILLARYIATHATIAAANRLAVRLELGEHLTSKAESAQSELDVVGRQS